MSNLIEIVLHFNKWLNDPANQGAIIYIVPFLLIFCETGLFFTPFLPGDSLIFAVGALCASSGMKLWIAAPLILAAGILGDTSNYNIGRMLGPRVLAAQLVA